jgi:hypothetical protein
MAELILPSRFTQQPQQAAPIDRSNPITQGLVFAWSAAQEALDLSASVFGVESGTRLTRSVSASGRQMLGVGTGQIEYAARNDLKFSGAPGQTLFSLAMIATPGSCDGSFLGRVSSSHDYRLAINSGSQAITYGTGGSPTSAVTASVAGALTPLANRPLPIAATFDLATARIYLDGNLSASAAQGNGFSTSNDRLALFARGVGGGETLTGAGQSLVLIFRRCLSPAEVASLSANPWQVFRAPPRRLWVAAAVTGAKYTLALGTGSFALTSVSARLIGIRRLAAAAAGYALTPTAASLQAARRITAAPGALSLTTTVAVLRAARRLPAAVGAIALSGTAAKLLAARKLTAVSSAFALAGSAATFVYTSAQAGTGATYTLTGGSGLFLLTVATGRMQLARRLVVAAGAYSAVGRPATVVAARRLPATAGSFATGVGSAGLRAARRLPVAAALFSFSSVTATLHYAPDSASTSPTYSLVAVGGALALVGTGAGLRAARRLRGVAGALAVTGGPARLLYGQQIEYARAPAGTGYAAQQTESIHRPTAAATARPAALQRNKR